MSNQIKKYKDKRGHTKYKFQIYIGRNPVTGSSRYVRKQGFDYKKDAVKALTQVKEQIKKGTYEANKTKHYRVCDLVEMWLKGYRLTVRESTYASTLRILNNHILPDLGTVYLDKLTVPKCMEVVGKWFKQAPKSVKKFMNYANIILDKGVQWQMIERNPMRSVDCPKYKGPTKQFNDFYSKRELERFLECAEKTQPALVFAFFRVLAYSGMRRGEAFALTWADVNFVTNTISVNKTVGQGINDRLVVDPPKTASGQRMLAMDSNTMNILREWHGVQRAELKRLGFQPDRPSQLVFATRSNGLFHPAISSEWNSKICKQNNLRHIKVHGFRHTHATLLLDSGASMEDVKERLGHSNISTTMDTYTHRTKQRTDRTAALFDQYMQA